MNDKTYCERCGNECKHSVYISEIDKTLICFDCRSNEQPKALMKRIKELEEENVRLESYNSQLRENYEKCIDAWKQENTKLQEQLKTVVMPRYKVGQVVWFVDEDDGEIRDARVLSIEIESRTLLYTILWGEFCELYRQEEFLFETEEEAKNYVKEVEE